MTTPTDYVLGSADPEIARLDAQAESIAGATAMLLRLTGIGPGMRVLDLGTGLGHVALELARLVGPEGAVLGVDQAPRMLRVAEQRAREAGFENVRFAQADARSFRDPGAFDAVVSRLLLFHLPDRVEVVRHHLEALRPGGLMVALEFDVGAARAEPAVPVLSNAKRWVEDTFAAVGADARIGARIGVVLRTAGVVDVSTVGVQSYVLPGDPSGPRMLAETVRSLLGPMVERGIATADEVGIDSLEARIADGLVVEDAEMLMPAVVAAWGQRAYN
jgi:SAM-dependent methyltransferase